MTAARDRQNVPAGPGPEGSERCLPPARESAAVPGGEGDFAIVPASPLVAGAAGREHFSVEELGVLEDTRPFRLRDKVMASMEQSFADLRTRLSRHLEKGNYLAPPGVDYRRGKVGQGEHLDGLPYSFVDLPRYVADDECFTYRTLFWWGDGVSFSLILGGGHLWAYRRRFLENLEILAALGVHLSLADNPWEWQRGRGLTVPVRPGAEEEILRAFRRQGFLKCSRFLEFADPEFRENRIDEAGLYTFRALEPLILN